MANKNKKVIKKITPVKTKKAATIEKKEAKKVMPSLSNAPYAIEMNNITKKFGNIYANKNVTLKIKKGEIHALLGENGAGKSTIMSILFGLYNADEGTIKINGKEEKINDPNDATNLKIGMVHQHFKLVECFTVLENIILGKEVYNIHYLEDAEKALNKDMTRLYIISGLLRIFDNYDVFINSVRNAKSVHDIEVDLYNKLKLTSSQIHEAIDNPVTNLTEGYKEKLLKEAEKLRKNVLADAQKENRLKTIWWKFIFALAKGLDWFNKKTCNIDKDKAAFIVTALSKRYGLEVDVNAKVEDITVGMQQRTEILKMLYRDADILIFDEPTAVLTPQEIKDLLQIMRNLKAEGKTVIFISHKLNEIMSVSDRVSILRRGELVKTLNVKDTTASELSDLMVGRHVNLKMDKKPVSKNAKTLLKVRNLTMFDKIKKKEAINNVNFDVKNGEIVTIAGIDGNGQRELVYGITGIEKVDSGFVNLNGVNLKNGNVKQRNQFGVSHIPEDRHKHGLVLDYSLEQNLVLRDYRNKEFNNFGFINKKNVREYSEKLINSHDIRSSLGSISSARSMSGGNQQKAIIARELERKPKLLIAVQPTRGVDVGAIEQIHKNLIAERDRGTGILLVSYELDEVYSLSDRILVMYEGEIVGEFKPKDITRQELGLYMSGAKKNYEFKEEVK